MTFSSIFKYVRDKILVQILIAILICIFSYPYLSRDTVSFLYAVSLFLRGVLVFVLPFLIITAISTAFARIPKGGFAFAIFLLVAICISNFVNLMVSFGIGKVIMSFNSTGLPIVHNIVDKIEKISGMDNPEINKILIDTINKVEGNNPSSP